MSFPNPSNPFNHKPNDPFRGSDFNGFPNFPRIPQIPNNFLTGFPNNIFTTDDLETSSINLALFTLGLELSNYNMMTREDLSNMGLVNSYSKAKLWALNILIHYKFKKK